MAELPLLRRFPGLANLPRAAFGTFPTPVEQVRLNDDVALLVKRDDRSGEVMGGNKIRALEWLLGGVRADARVLTVGPRGSTHALATAIYANQVRARVTVVRWDQEMNPAARAVDARLRREAHVIDAHFVGAAYPIAAALRLRGDRWIPAGGASPLGVLGHVNAALELADQIERGECERPDHVIVPLGTGATAAGLALGTRVAGIDVRVVAVRVVPKIVGRLGRVVGLADAAASLIERVTGARLPRVSAADVQVEERFYGGGYGHRLEIPAGVDDVLARAGIRMDDTYSRKALVAALAGGHQRALLWLTFDGRLLETKAHSSRRKPHPRRRPT